MKSVRQGVRAANFDSVNGAKVCWGNFAGMGLGNFAGIDSVNGAEVCSGNFAGIGSGIFTGSDSVNWCRGLFGEFCWNRFGEFCWNRLCEWCRRVNVRQQLLQTLNTVIVTSPMKDEIDGACNR